jgi:uncharacterized protein YjiS (DUF1127 family)
MTWPFGRKKEQRYERVTALEEQARAGEIKLVEKVLELDRKRTYLRDLNQLTEAALKDLGGPHRV